MMAISTKYQEKTFICDEKNAIIYENAMWKWMLLKIQSKIVTVAGFSFLIWLLCGKITNSKNREKSLKLFF